MISQSKIHQTDELWSVLEINICKPNVKRSKRDIAKDLKKNNLNKKINLKFKKIKKKIKFKI